MSDSMILAAAISAVAIYLAWSYAPVIAGLTLKVLISILAVGLIFFINSFLVPYFGDVARYVRATPETVAQRAAIRERGMKLLRALHDLDSNGKPIEGKEPTYGRVILVGHSLGSIVAYDLLMQFWSEAGPLKKVLEGSMLDKWKAMDGYLKGKGAGKGFGLAKFREYQRAIIETMLEAGEAWRITDFVTIGSPLTHAEFLISDNANRFHDLVLKRLLAMSPPYPYENGEESVIYKVSGDGEDAEWAVHHAAPFAATRWTNIYDQREWVFCGDVISGNCTGNFGDGIEEHDVTIRRPTSLWERSRVFTHTSYWDLNAYGLEKRVGKAKTGKRLTHIGVLRTALDLAGYPEFYPARKMGGRNLRVADTAGDDAKKSA